MSPETALEVLNLPGNDNNNELDASRLKKAYHEALRQAHPDKSTPNAPSRVSKTASTHSVDTVKAAYQLLLTLLGSSDEQGARRVDRGYAGYAVLDLDDFEYCAHSRDNGNTQRAMWRHPCRCGHEYVVTEEDLAASRDLVACLGCSLLVKVTFEEAPGSDEET